mgnify:CR=1 FL=1
MFALADTAMAFASNSHNEAHLALNANIDFLRPAQLGAEEPRAAALAQVGQQHRQLDTAVHHLVELGDAPVEPAHVDRLAHGEHVGHSTGRGQRWEKRPQRSDGRPL